MGMAKAKKAIAYEPATSRQTFFLWTMDKEKDWKGMAANGKLSKTDASTLIDTMVKEKKATKKAKKFKVNGLATDQGSAMENAMEIVKELIKSGVLKTA